MKTITKTILIAMLALIGWSGSVNAQAPTLGIYANTTVMTGKNITITPNASPTNSIYAMASTSIDFTGILTVNPITGIVTVTNPKNAGTYTITVKAFNNFGSNQFFPIENATTTTFVLTVTNPACSQGYFLYDTHTSVAVADKPTSIAVGDFNNDGLIVNELAYFSTKLLE